MMFVHVEHKTEQKNHVKNGPTTMGLLTYAVLQSACRETRPTLDQVTMRSTWINSS